MARIKEYPDDLIRAGNEFRHNRTRRAKEILFGMIHYLSRNLEYSEAFFDGFSINAYFIPKEYGPIRRWKYKRAFSDGYHFRCYLIVHKVKDL